MYLFLPRCVVYGRDCGGTIILQKSCVNQVLQENKSFWWFSCQNSVAQAFQVTKPIL